MNVMTAMREFKQYPFKRLLDLQDKRNTSVYVGVSFAVLLLAAIIIRKDMIGFGNADYDIFSSWYDYVKLHGINSFSTDFSNYNPPYTYFLYLITLLPIGKMLAIKGLMIVFDLLLALSVYLVVKKIRPSRYVPAAAATATMFLPAVLATGVLWGQFDQFYTAFLMLSLYYLLKDNSKLAWIHFGIAIAIKLQAIFFLPVLVMMSFKRIKAWHALYAGLAFVLLTFLPMLAGRSLQSILNIYVAQTDLFKGNLTLNAPNIYQWIPNEMFDYFNHAGIIFTFAVVIGFFVYSVLYQKYSNRDILLLTSIMLFLVPFLLPQMHERYFFTATVASFILIFAIPRLIWVAITMQLIVLFSYVPFLFHQSPPIPFSILALVSLVLCFVLTKEFIGSTVVRKRNI